MIPEDSAAAHKSHNILAEEKAKKDRMMIRLYEESGVYNFYLKTAAPGSKVEAAQTGGSKAGQVYLKALSRPGFHWQQRA